MIINFLILSLSSFLAGSLILVFLPHRLRAVKVIGPLTTVTGSVFGMLSAILSFISGPVESVGFALSSPSGSFALGMDSLSALFAIPVLFISSLCAVYSTGYLKPFELHGKDTSRFWSFFNLLAGSMLLVTVSRNALLFLLGWEVMALSSFFLVMFEAAEGTVRKAGWTYLVATHLGTACLLVLFSMLSLGGSMNFTDLAVPVGASASAAFILAMIGFGVKAGFVPLHVWLPEAHPSAPSNVSAVMSGVMIKTGIYGLLRFLPFLGSPPAWWGWVLLLTGIVSGIAGVLFALAQHDLKRLLAYSSVENIGIITIGLGLGFLGISYNIPAMACLGFAGAVLHVLNHAVFKSLLFMGAGSVVRETGSKQIDQLGGLLKRMPATGISFFTGSAAISGFPPFNGFISELIIYLAAFSGLTAVAGTASSAALAGLLAAGALALIGGLALACFTRAFGIAFLGEPRSLQAQNAQETAFSMRFSMWFLSVACIVLGLAGPFMLVFLWPVAVFLCNGFGYYPPGVSVPLFVNTLEMVTLVSVFVIIGAVILFSARSRLLSQRKVTKALTWDCGYSSPSPSMQYTASSFSDPLIRLFGSLIGTRHSFREPKGLFPEQSSFASETPDVCQEKLYRPFFTRMEKLFGGLRMIQHGRVNLYILYIVAALFALLAWKLG